MKRFKIYLFLTWFAVFTLLSNETVKLTVRDGISHNYITDIAVDKSGLLWIGTRDGLNIYDGYSFLPYRYDPEKKGSIPNNFIRCISIDPYNIPWIGTNNGLCFFDRKEQIFTRIELPDEYSKHNLIILSVLALENEVWFRTQQVLIKYDRIKNKFKSIPISLGSQDLGYSHINRPISENESIITPFSQGIIQIFPNDSIRIIQSDKIEQLLAKYRGKNLSIVNKNTEWIDLILNNQIYSISTDSESVKVNLSNKDYTFIGNVQDNYIATGVNYIDIYDKELNLLKKFSFPGKLANVSKIIATPADIYWFATDDGLYKLDTKSKQLQVLKSNEIFNLQKNITSINQKDADLLIGSQTGLYQLHDNYTIQDTYLSNRIINSIFTNKNDIIYLGTDSGLYFLSKGKTNIIPIYTDDTQQIWPYINVIEQSNNGYLWVGTRNTLFQYFPETGQMLEYQYFYDGEDTISLGSVNDIYVYNGLELFATDEGLIVSHVNGEYDQAYSSFTNDFSSMDFSSVYSINRDSSGMFWLGTANGLYMFNNEEQTFTLFTTKQGLPHNFVKSIELDNDNSLWLSTNYGICKFNPETKEVYNFTLSDGIGDLSFNTNSSYFGKDGTLYFAGENITLINTDSLILYERNPKTVLSELKIMQAGRTFTNYIENHDSVNVDYNFENIIVTLSSDDYTDPALTRYKYSFTKVGNEEWNFIDQNTLIIPNKNPGIYQFKAKASSVHGVWGDNAFEFFVIIKTPLWKTTFAYIIYFLSVITLFYLLFLYRTRQLRNSNRIYRERERIAREVEQQKEELTIQNKNIKASISYAKRIQQAMMPSEKLFNSILPSSFILHIPKDIVSGDFYWINQDDERIYVAAVDCTGHGVPGAFMSIIGIELFRKITKIHGITKPADILDRLNEDFAAIFNDVDNITLRDGMDVALCIIDKNNKKIEYAGAFNPLYLIRDNKITEIKADRFSVGIDESDFGKQQFNNNELKFNENDMVYIFSDGYADQFGGPEGKKFKYRRFRHLLLTLHQLPLEKQKEFLEQSIIEWKGDLDQVDDILVIGIKL